MNVRKDTFHLCPTDDAMLKVFVLEPWYRDGRQQDCRCSPNKCNVVTIADNAANTEREMRGQQTDAEEGQTAADVAPHDVRTEAGSLFLKVGYGGQIDEIDERTFCKCKSTSGYDHENKESAEPRYRGVPLHFLTRREDFMNRERQRKPGI